MTDDASGSDHRQHKPESSAGAVTQRLQVALDDGRNEHEMPRWEYLRAHCYQKGLLTRKWVLAVGNTDYEMMLGLNLLGRLGWELVAIDNGGGGMQASSLSIYVFKRRLSPTSDT